MILTKEMFSEYIKSFNFKGLFNYLGWDNARVTLPHITLKGEEYTFTPIAHKSSFLIVECRSSSGAIPSYTVRSRIDNEFKKQVQEHMIIFCNKKNTEQVWLYSYTFNGKSRKTEVIYNTKQDTERLYQRAAGLFFSIDEQDNITIFDVTKRMSENFAVNTEKVTKKFFEGFKKQHGKFVVHMDGISEAMDREWYASIMLNRLMFTYFIQKRGFLDNDTDYLRTKLKECTEKKGRDVFYSFYRNFLLILFHDGFANPAHNRELTDMIGQVPYLNGGIFDVHIIEKKYPNISIDDEAFAAVFDFFDTYEWHLDSRECASGNEISPDVLGFIFEKYINDRSKMGAYYTQEDITEYIGRNSIIPYLLFEVERKYKDAFAPDREVWTHLKESGDKYIFDAIKTGVIEPLPDYISQGISTTEPDLHGRRSRWNEPADANVALPAETWREVVDRRRRYTEILEAIQSGKITSVQDFITYNLDICSFAQDLCDTVDDPAFIRAFYEAIKGVTVLDPTCGSGAFLFAALNILEPLYDSCINRMEDFLYSGAMLPKNTRRLFEDTIDSKDEHPNKPYFIIKTIILNNLYGVDIMKEAVETTKLRLFLKLVSTATPDYYAENLGIEPLPDIDFNIKSGNTLVGYATEDAVTEALKGDIFNLFLEGEVLEKLRQLSMATHRFRTMQLEAEENRTNFNAIKEDVYVRQREVNEILNKTMCSGRNYSDDQYGQWLKETQPFHWISEFYSIISSGDGRGGFDVIIGNPPYVEYSEKDFTYRIENYETQRCGNLYAYIMEKCKHIINPYGIIGMIVPLSGHSTDRMEPLVTNFYNTFSGRYIMNLSADANPSHLFAGVKFRLAIFFVSDALTGYYSTKYRRWYSEERPNLFKNIEYNSTAGYSYKHVLTKVPSPFYARIYNKVQAESKRLWAERGDEICYYHNAPVNWVRSHTFTPYFCSERDGVGITTQLKKIQFENRHDMIIASCILNSTLFFVWWISQSDCYHLNAPEIANFGFTIKNDEVEEELVRVADLLAKDMVAKSKRRVYHYKTSGRVEYDEFYMKKSKEIIDLIDRALGKHYGLSDEELDYIINYEIKYRTGLAD